MNRVPRRLGGGKLIGRDDRWQPSALMFPSPVNELLVMSGIAAKSPAHGGSGGLSAPGLTSHSRLQLTGFPELTQSSGVPSLNKWALSTNAFFSTMKK